MALTADLAFVQLVKCAAIHFTGTGKQSFACKADLNDSFFGLCCDAVQCSCGITNAAVRCDRRLRGSKYWRHLCGTSVRCKLNSHTSGLYMPQVSQISHTNCSQIVRPANGLLCGLHIWNARFVCARRLDKVHHLQLTTRASAKSDPPGMRQALYNTACQPASSVDLTSDSVQVAAFQENSPSMSTKQVPLVLCKIEGTPAPKV